MNTVAKKWLKERQEESEAWAKRSFYLESWNAGISSPELIGEIILNKYNIDRKKELKENYNTPIYWFDELAKDLFKDLKNISNDEKLSQCALAFIPDIKGNAISVNVERKQEYAIALNIGLIWLCMFIVQAIMLEHSSFDDRGKRVFILAKKLFLTTSSKEFHEILNKIQSISDEHSRVESGAIATVLLKFIALHEFGHIKLGHVDYFNRNLTITDKCGVETIYNNDVSTHVHKEEFSADIYALDSLIKSASSKEVAWNQTMYIYAFFLTLESIEEDIASNICPQHPSPKERANSIFNRAGAVLGKPKNDLFIWINIVFNTWKGKYMKEIKFSIRTEDKKSLMELFQGDNELNVDGFLITYKGETKESGMTMTDIVLSFGISLVAGIPSGMVSAYLYDKFVKGGENIMNIEGDVVKGKDSLEKIIDTLIS